MHGARSVWRSPLYPSLGGVKIYEYGPALMHAKTMIVDGVMASLGSTNLDNRSFALNEEINLVVYDTRVASQLEKHFEEDLERDNLQRLEIAAPKRKNTRAIHVADRGGTLSSPEHSRKPVPPRLPILVGQFLVAIVTLSLYLMPVLRPLNLIAADSEPNELRCLALTVYWEARADGRKAMEAVGWVVLNRVKNPHFPDTVCQVVREGGEKSPCQFSYWCDGEPDKPKNEDAWAEAEEVADRLLNKPSADPTGGALFYHAVGVTPNWAKEHKRTVTIGGHVFYR